MTIKSLATGMLVAALGCANATEVTEPQSTDIAVKAAHLTSAPSSNDPLPDEPSPQAIIVYWGDDSSEREAATQIDAVLENTTDVALQVRIDVVALDQGEGKEFSHDLGPRVVKAHSSEAVRIPMARIPLQTAGTYSAVRVRATYSMTGENPFTGEQGEFEGAALSEPRFVTFDANLGLAGVRNYHAQLGHNTMLGEARQIEGKRALDSTTGQMRTVPAHGLTMSL